MSNFSSKNSSTPGVSNGRTGSAAQSDPLLAQERFLGGRISEETDRKSLDCLRALVLDLRTQNQRLRHQADEAAGIIHAAGLTAVLLDRDLTIRRITPAARAIFGLTDSDLGRSAGCFQVAVQCGNLAEQALRVLQHEDAREAEGQAADGSRYCILLRPQYTDFSASACGVLCTFTKIVEQEFGEYTLHHALLADRQRTALAIDTPDNSLKQSYTCVQRRLAELEKIYNLAPVGLCFLSKDFRYLYINERLAGINGLPVEAHLAQRVADLKPDIYRLMAPWWRKLLKTGEPVSNVELTLGDGEKGQRHWMASYHPLTQEDGAILGINVVVQEITERKHMEEALRTSQQRLAALNQELEDRVVQRTSQVRGLSAALTMAEQWERERIAQVLHDDLQQILYGIQIRAELLNQDLPAEARCAVEDKVKDIQELMGQALRVTRTLTIEYTPPIIESEDLGSALDWLIEHIHDLYGLTVEAEVAPDCHIAHAGIRLLLVQLTREFLFNVVKHADVSTAYLRAYQNDNQQVIEVIDRGSGFDSSLLNENRPKPKSTGLASVHRRLALLGGSMCVESTPATGTKVTISIPLFPEDEPLGNRVAAEQPLLAAADRPD